MKTTVYKSLSNRQETVAVAAGQTVAAAFPGMDFKNAVVIVNGRERTADYVLREGDVVTIRELPAGITTAAVIALVAIAVGVGVYGGIQIYKAKKAAEEAQKELEKVKKQSNKDDIDNRPFLRGASNTLAREKSQPYICGRHLFTPYLLCSPFYKITGTDGADEYTYIALECGFNKQILRKIAIDDIAIKTFSDTSPQEGACGIDAGIFADDGRIEIAQDGQPFGELTELNHKVVSANCNDEIPRDVKVDAGDAEHLTYTLDANAMNVEVAITFPYGLYAYNDEGTKIETKVTITTQYSLDGGETWKNIKEHQFSRNVSSKELRFTESKGFSWNDYYDLHNHGQKNILLRVRSDGSDDPKIKNDCYVMFYQSRCFDPEKSTYPAGAKRDDSRELVPCKILEDRERAFCTVIGLKLKATGNNEDKLKKVNIITQGVARTWNGSSWSAGKSATSNPAAWALEILTSDSHPMSRFADGEIDLESFGDFYEHCETNKFRFDYVITQGRKKGDTLDLIMQNCGAVLYRDLYGRLAVAIDRAQPNAIAVYNPQNIISIQNKKSFGRRTDGLRIKYTSSEDDLYQEDTYLLMREVNGKPLELNADSAIKDVTVTGITTFAHVVKYARRMMALEALRPKTTTIEVGNEGIYFTPFSKILLQDDSLKIGTGNGVVRATQWENGLLKKIVLDCPVTFESGKRYGATVNCFGGGNKAVPVSVRVSGEGHTDLLTVETSVPDTSAAIPEIGCVVSFGELDGTGEFGRITTPYLISGISRSDKGFRLELVNYNTAVYSSGVIPDYRSNITQKPPVRNEPIPPDYVTREEMVDAIVNGIDTDTEPPDTPIVSECRAYRDYVSMKFDALPESDRNTLRNVEWQVNKTGLAWEDFHSNLSFSARYDFDRGTDGYPEREDLDWQFRCRVTNTRGIASDWSAPIAADTSGYGTWRVSSVKDAYAKTDGSDSMRLRFDGGRPSARQYYGSTRFTVTVKYDGKPVRTEADVPYSLYYHFDRETDGYPERHVNAADGIRDLSLYSFTIRPVESITGETGEDVTVSVDDSSYGTWLIPPMETSAEAGEHLVTLRWGLDGATPYGKTLYDVFLGGEPLKEGMSGSYYAYRFAESLSAEEVAALKFSVRARNEAHERTAEFSVDTSGYLGYKVEKPWIRAAARKEGIDVSWDRTNDFYGKCEFVLLKDGEEIFRSAREREFFLPFGEGEFPEKDDILAITLTVRIEGDADSAESDPAETDVSGYLTWTPQVPKVYPSASGRNASLSWDAQDGVYGFTGCEVQIAKAYRVADGKMSPVTDAEELEWFAPALGLNPYESLENYKRGEASGRLEVGGLSVSLTLPLFGQDGGGASDTPYAFRLRGKSASGKVSGWTEALFVTCRAVSAYDVTKAWDLDDKGEKVKVDGALGAAQIFVEELSAIAANLGFITDGALKGNAYNYWAVGDVRSDDGSMLWRGSFRVGGKEQYILVEPRLKDGTPTGEYDITFVVGNFSVSATGTQMRGGAFEVFDDDGNLVFRAAPEGSRIRVAEGQFSSTESEADIPKNETDEIESGSPYLCPLITYDGDLYFVRYGTYNNKVTTQIWKLPKNALNGATKHMEIKNLLYSDIVSPKALSPVAINDYKVSLPGVQRENAGIFEINLKLKISSFKAFPELAGIGDFTYINLSNNLFVTANDTLYWLKSSGLTSVYQYGNYQTAFCGGKIFGNHAYFLVAHSLLTLIIRIDVTTGHKTVAILAGVVFGTVVVSGAWPVPSFSVNEDAITIFSPVYIAGDDGTFSSPTARKTHGILRVPFSTARWNEMGGDSLDSIVSSDITIPDLYDTYIGMSDSGDEKKIVPILHFDALDGIRGLMIDTSAGQMVRRLVLIVPQTQAEPVSHDYYTLMGSATWQEERNFPVADDARTEQNIEFYLAGLPYTSIAQLVDGIPSYHVLAQYIQPGGMSPELRLYTMLMDENLRITGSNVYSAGIGFSAIYFDSTSKKYRYYLDTGAYIEFNEDGTLSAQTGAQGTPGRDGRDGKDGADGADGKDGEPGSTPEISVTATVDGGTGEPSVEVKKSGTAESQSFALAFKNLKGERGERGEKGEKGDTGERGATGAQGPKGDKGDTGPQGATGTTAGAALTTSNPISNTNPGRLAAGKISVHTVYNAGGPATYGNLLNIGGSGGGQLFVEWSGNQSAVGGSGCGRVFYRSWRDNQAGWTAWQQVGGMIPTSQPANLENGMIWIT